MISNIQVLRGLAALAVVFAHTHYGVTGLTSAHFQAVKIFFVISGFIMTLISRDDARHFLAARLIRIVPLYWLATFVQLIGTHISLGTIQNLLAGSPMQARQWATELAALLTSQEQLSALAKSLFFIPYQTASGGWFPVLEPGWTLNMEMMFYCLFAVALRVSRRWAPALVAFVLIVAITVSRAANCRDCITDFFANGFPEYFLAGISVYYVWHALEQLVTRATAAASAFACAVLFVAGGLDQYAPLVGLIPIAVVITALLAHAGGIRCTWRPLLVLGDASYALYLTHFTVLQFSDPVVDMTHNAAATIAVIIGCVVFAVFVHHMIERPICRALRRLIPCQESEKKPLVLIDQPRH